MVINQVYSIINSINEQMFGSEAVAVTDLTGLISLGKTVLSSGTNKDNFLNTLMDRIGKTIISQRPYSPDVLAALMEDFEFGAVLQKIHVAEPEAIAAAHWDLTAESTVDQFIITPPTVTQKLFSGINTWEVDLTIPDLQLKTAFTSAESMAAFFDAVFVAMRNSMEVQLESMVNATYCNFIAERVVHTSTGGHTVINLLDDYNDLKGFTGVTPAPDPLTAAVAMITPEFLKYAATQIKLYLKRMGRMSVLFNSDGVKRFTPPDMARVIVHADFAAATEAYMESDTYHNDLVKLPNYTEVPYWQGSGETYAFADSATVNVKTTDGYTVEQDGVICLMTDRDALGTMIRNQRTNSAHNARGEYTNYFNKADMGYFNDLSENGIVFIVSDAVATPVPPAGG